MRASGVTRGVGLDINTDYLKQAAETAAADGLKLSWINASEDEAAERLSEDPLDIVYSVDAFEHIQDTAKALRDISDFLKPGGEAWIWFGPLWRHPRGMHMGYLRPLPWTHLIFSERTVMAVRNEYRQDGKTTYAEAGLSQMTAAKFRRYVEECPLEIESFEVIPIRGCRWLAKLPAVGSCFESCVRAKLRKPMAGTVG